MPLMLLVHSMQFCCCLPQDVPVSLKLVHLEASNKLLLAFLGKNSVVEQRTTTCCFTLMLSFFSVSFTPRFVCLFYKKSFKPHSHAQKLVVVVITFVYLKVNDDDAKEKMLLSSFFYVFVYILEMATGLGHLQIHIHEFTHTCTQQVFISRVIQHVFVRVCLCVCVCRGEMEGS